VASPNTPKQPEKISADCPHCGFSQLESVFAKSTFCRKCGQHYSIEKLLAREAGSLKAPSMFDKLSKMVTGEKIRDISCFSCGHRQKVSTSAQSSICPGCASYIDLRDFKISGPFGRSIQTQGEVFITSKGDVTSAKIACGSAFIEGKMRGNLSCTGTVSVKLQGKLLGTIETHHLDIVKRSKVEFVRPIKVHSAEINGKVSARITCETGLTITKGGELEGVVYAKAINVERGGIFSGELFIGQQQLTQAELLGAGDDHPRLFGDETLGLGPA
jgi:cytoskeletal protein CcmA (bactofilin family)